MAVVSTVPGLPQTIRSIQIHGVGTAGLMARGGEIEEEPITSVVEEKIYVAVGKEVKESKSNLLWALQNSGGKKICILHVHQPSQTILLMGGKFPVNKLDEQEVKAHRTLERKKKHMTLIEYLLICARLGVRAEKLDIEMENIEKGIIELINQHGIKRLVMGAASDKHYSKKMTVLKSKKAIALNEQAPLTCHIWFVCKGCLIRTRDGSLDGAETGASPSQLVSPISGTGQSDHLRSRSVTEGMSNAKLTNPVQDFFRRVRSGSFYPQGGRLTTLSTPDGTEGMPMPQNQMGAEGSADELEGTSKRSPSQGSGHSTWSSSEDVAVTSDSLSSVRDDGSDDVSVLPSVHESEEDGCYSSPLNELQEVNDEIYNQLQQAMVEAEKSKREAYEESVRRRKSEIDAIDAIRKAKASESLYANEMKQRKELEEALARETLELNKMKNQKNEVLEELRTAQDKKLALESQLADTDQMVKQLEEKFVSAVELLISLKEERDRLQLERDNAVREAEELRKLREEETGSSQRSQFFSEFSFSEIEEATHSFDPSLMIGEGGYGSVYKGLLRNTEVAIKMLQLNSSQGRAEFQQEVDILSRVRHPNLVTLIGTCPEAWALLYEYLPNGSLEDRLICKDNTPPLSWQMRTRIAIEICSALVFLHSNHPHGIVHGDLKPANILLDANFISKLGDFGICRIVSHDENSTNTTTPSCITSPKGTFVYMDPEFVATGELTPKSDVYSFGIVLLRLLTGRPALGIVKEVQYALGKGNLNELLDVTAGDWPFVQAKQLAHVALRCCELSRKNRPDLGTEVWRVLEPMKASCGASFSFRLGSEERGRIPSYFVCPILQEIMRDPHVAADGFTYEAEALKGWLEGGHNTSPMTNLQLTHRNLVPNHSLRSAIQEWLQQP